MMLSSWCGTSYLPCNSAADVLDETYTFLLRSSHYTPAVYDDIICLHTTAIFIDLY